MRLCVCVGVGLPCGRVGSGRWWRRGSARRVFAGRLRRGWLWIGACRNGNRVVAVVCVAAVLRVMAATLLGAASRARWFFAGRLPRSSPMRHSRWRGGLRLSKARSACGTGSNVSSDVPMNGSATARWLRSRCERALLCVDLGRRDVRRSRLEGLAGGEAAAFPKAPADGTGRGGSVPLGGWLADATTASN
jgi:hypothetical protein